MSANRFIVRGKVQGVWFRASTRDRALALGLCGHAKNLPDGTVEVVARGEPEAVEMLAEWLREGPPMARVESVTRSAADPCGIGQEFVVG